MDQLPNEFEAVQTDTPANSRYVVKVLKAEMITHNVRRFMVEKPPGYAFVPGQATDVSINQPGLKEELRPFTFTSLNQSDHLEFMIKIYKGHNGVTEKLEAVNTGDALILHEVFGTITYKGPGIFIAGGAGITPFIAILRQLQLTDQLAGNTLLFANRTAEDIILGEELKEILSENYRNVLEISSDTQAPGRFIDKDLLADYVQEGRYYYICGPDKFVQIMRDYLLELGVISSRIIVEE